MFALHASKARIDILFVFCEDLPTYVKIQSYTPIKIHSEATINYTRNYYHDYHKTKRKTARIGFSYSHLVVVVLGVTLFFHILFLLSGFSMDVCDVTTGNEEFCNHGKYTWMVPMFT